MTGILPRLIAIGSDPFAFDSPVSGFPAVAIQPLGRRGIEYFVSPRTVVSWVEVARARGILIAPPSSGATGGHLLNK